MSAGGLAGVVLSTLVIGGICSTAGASAAECPNAKVRGASDRALPDCRAYEQVSPADKNGVDVNPGGFPTAVGAMDGSGVTYETTGVFPGADAALTFNANLSRRTASGWQTKVLAPAQSPIGYTDYSLFQYFTPNLDHTVVRTPKGPSHAAGDTVGMNNLYLRDNVSDAYTTLSVRPSATRPPGSFSFAGASRGLHHVAFGADDALTPDAPVPPLPPQNGFANLYEWVAGQLRLVTILPDGTPADHGGNPGGPSGAPSPTVMSEDGSRIFFGTPPETTPDGAQIYLREDGQRTIEVSASQRATPDPGGPAQPSFWGASADGSVVLFSSPLALTEDATLGVVSLYLYDVDSARLTNLSVDADPGAPPGGGVSGVLGFSRDGTQVYFESTRQHVAGKGTPGMANVYRWHDGNISYVLTDAPGALGSYEGNLKTVRVTPDGQRMAFMSSSSLTGYDNNDVVTGQPDSQVFLYDAPSDRLTCVSCNPSGARPSGPSTLPAPPARAVGNLQRGVSDDGRRVFFDSRDALVPTDVNGKTDVYEYEDGAVSLISSGSGSSDSVFAAASATGDDVFFVTRERLASTDVDDNLDMYDARVGGGFARPAAPAPCSGDACQAPAAAAPVAREPTSSSVVGGGNATTSVPRPASFRVGTLSRSARRQAARTGYMTLSVHVSRGGIVRARASKVVRGRSKTVGSAETNVPRAATVHLRLRLAKSTRTALARKAKVRLSLRVSFSHVREAKTSTLELQR